MEMPGEISGMVGTNVLNNQLQTGEIETPTIFLAIKDSGVIDVTLENCKQGDNDEEMNEAESKNKKCNQGTQTKLLSTRFTMRDKVLHESVDETQL